MDKYRKLAIALVSFANYLADDSKKLTIQQRGFIARALRRAELMNSSEPDRQRAKRRNYQLYKKDLQKWSDELSKK